MISTRQYAAIMFSDIAGFTTVMGNDEQTGLKLLHDNRDLQKPLIEQYGGRWIKEMGDGILASFDNAYDAIKCGLTIQQTAGADLLHKIRIGIHFGEVIMENDDIFGDEVNIASRLETIGNPGGVYFSESVKHAVEQFTEFRIHYVGELRLKNVNRPIKTYCLQETGMPVPISSRIKECLLGVIRSLAVLPFHNLSGDQEQEYFVNGMQDALITEISKLGSLRVISRTSTLPYRNSDKTIPQIAMELNVDGIIEGSVYKVDNGVRIQVQLLEAFPEEKHLWAKSYDQNIENIFDLHSAVVRDVAEKIKIKLTPQEIDTLSSGTQVNPEAYKSYLNGKFHMYKLSLDGFKNAFEYFNKSVEIDPNFAPALAELANYYIASLQMRLVSVTEAFPKIYHYNRKALQIDPALPEANFTQALMSWFEWDWDACEKGFQKVLDHNPNHVQANAFFGHYYLLKNRFDLAFKYAEKAVGLDPQNDLILFLYGVVLTHFGKIEQALEVGNKAFHINPDSIATLRLLEFASFLKQDLDTSVEMLHLIYSKIFPIDLDIKAEYAAHGYRKMIENLAQILKESTRGQDIYIVVFLNRAGKTEEAIQWVQRAYENHDGDVPYFFRVLEVKNLKSDPRIAEIAEKIQLPL